MFDLKVHNTKNIETVVNSPKAGTVKDDNVKLVESIRIMLLRLSSQLNLKKL